ncbi:Fe-S cluster assembly protein SufD [Paenalcaligenes hominis]|uniref:Fe-S cluster assembly protein SufD n=1 Tax=Paenalcaligenes hominis TaxID=643674 RepID=A0ABX0WSM3_9BURK|nr:Fe-S cluster assembly protein SufD [Paenalcaligenes hominis]NJB65770.1 Fe-S cluster assembly protein SufD [Paenalcaligenes hominis]GGE69548.1 Fe-S cluster assembly protein SufD [Paenalcaligenes hominis]
MTSLPTWVNPFVAKAAEQTGTPGWLSELRQQALARFAAEGWPTSRLEAWRHTSLAIMEQKSYELAQSTAAADALVRACKNEEDGYWLTFVNGQFDADASTVMGTESGLRLASVAQLLRDESDTLEAIYGNVDMGSSPEALNLALAQDGAYVRVAQGVQIAKPIHLVYINTDTQSATFTRSFIALEAGAHATVVEHYLSTDDYAGLTNSVTRIWTDRDANLTHLKLQNQSEKSVHLAAVDAEQEQASHYESHSLSFGAQLARTGIETHFKGQQCHALLNGLYYVNDRRHVDHFTQIHHEQPNCTSHEYYRGVMADRGRGVFSGRIIVYEGADGTDAIQRSDSLLLSKLARADTKPELEIYADDVKCAHGATVGQLDKDSMFYLRSRGLSHEEAYDVLIYAFAAQVLERIQSESLRQRATKGIQNLLPGGKKIGEQI